MAALDNTIEITPDVLKTSFAKYRKDIIKMPVRALDEAAKFMSRRVGVRGKETVGELAGDMELGPYSLTRKDENGVTITAVPWRHSLVHASSLLSQIMFVSLSMAPTYSRAMRSKTSQSPN